MRSLILSLILMLPLLVGAQGFGSFSHDQPFLAKDAVGGGGDYPGYDVLSSVTNIAIWLVSSDVPVGEVISNQWVDRISGVVFQQGDATKQPTNSALGVYFNGSTYLTNIAFTVGSTTPLRAIICWIFQPAIDGAFHIFWGERSNPEEGYGLQNNNRLSTWRGASGANQPAGVLSALNNTLFDAIVDDCNWRTNGVSAGSSAAANMVPFSPTVMTYYDSSAPFKGYLRELIVWTNTGYSDPAPDNVISNIHYYGTNMYGYSP